MIRQFIAKGVIRFQRPKTLQQFKTLQSLQHQTELQISEMQNQLLHQILSYASQHCPLYSTRIPTSLISNFNLEYFKEIPLLEKETLKQNFDLLRSQDLTLINPRENRSGGSTGIPTRHLQDEHFRQMDMANNLLFKSWAGSKPGDKSLFIAADERDYFGHYKGMREKLINFIFNKSYFNAFKLTDSAFEEIAKILCRLKPQYIQLYSSIALELSRYLIRNQIQIPVPRMVMCIAGSTPDDLLTTVEQAFQAPILSRYGSRETGDMAGMCKYRHYHEMALTHYLEVLDDANRPLPPGQIGHIAVTVLTNRALPLIRYKIGDMGMWLDGPCPCGVGFRALQKIAGRTGEIFKNSKGKIIPPEIFIHLVGVALGDLSDNLLRYQIIQESLSQIEVKMILRDPNASGMEAKLSHLRNSIQKVMEEDVSVAFNRVSEIPKLASGKYSYTISRIQ